MKLLLARATLVGAVPTLAQNPAPTSTEALDPRACKQRPS